MIVTVSIIIILLFLLYKYATSTFGHWKKLGVAGPEPKILSGNFPSTLNRKRYIAYEIDEIYR